MYQLNATMSETEVNSTIGAAIVFLVAYVAVLASPSAAIDMLAGVAAFGSLSIIGYIAYVFSQRSQRKNIENQEKFAELTSQIEALKTSINSIDSKLKA